MAISKKEMNLDPLLRNRRDFPDNAEDQAEHLWWNVNADLVERLWANDGGVRTALRSEYLGKVASFFSEGAVNNATIIELGSGSGWVGRYLVQGSNNNLLGIDLSEAQVTLAKNNADAANLDRQCKYICANISDSVKHINEDQIITGLLIHAILHHLTKSEIDQLLINVVNLAPQAKFFAYEPVFFPNIRGENNTGFISRASKILAVTSALSILILMRIYGRVISASRDKDFLDRVDKVSRDAIKNQWVFSPKEIVFDQEVFLATLGKSFNVKRTYCCNYLDIEAATMAAILFDKSHGKWMYIKFFIPVLRLLDKWLVASGSIYELCNGKNNSKLISLFFPKFCFWGVECIPLSKSPQDR